MKLAKQFLLDLFFLLLQNWQLWENHYASTLHVFRDPASEYLINCWEFFIFQQSCFLRIVLFLILSLLENKNLWFQVLKRFSKKIFFFLKYCSFSGNTDQSDYFLAWKSLYALLCDQLNVQFSSVAQLCPTFCDPIDCSTPGFPVHHQFPELAQTHVHWVGDADWTVWPI